MSDRVTIRVQGLGAKARMAITESSEPDAAAIAEALFDDVNEQEIRRALRLVVEREATSMRREATQRAEAEARASERAAEQQAIREEADGRLAELAGAHQAQIADRFFSTWKQTPTGRKFLGECTAADLRWSAEEHEKRSQQALDAAGRDARLADAIERAGVETVRDLGYGDARDAIADRRQP